MEENNRGLAIAGYVLSLIGLFIFPVLSILGLIFCAIAVGTNEKEPGFKAVWNYKNKAYGYGLSAVIMGLINVAYLFIQLV